MIIYGWKGFESAKEELNENCPHCGKPFTMSVHIIYQYFHIFWIPMFPYQKKVIAHCSSCGVAYDKRNMHESLRLAYQNSKAKKSMPVWMFSGVIIIAGLITWGIASSALRDHHTKEYVYAPAAGDVYEMYLEGSYTTWKVKSVKGDSVELLWNEYTTDRKDGFPELKDMSYNDTSVMVAASTIAEEYNEGKLLGVDRE